MRGSGFPARPGPRVRPESLTYPAEEIMTRIIYDAALKEKLPNLDEPIELCDKEGRVLARIERVLDPVLYDREPRISMEELTRRRSYKGKTYTTAEVLAYLEQL
jgi:hypothetical protein